MTLSSPLWPVLGVSLCALLLLVRGAMRTLLRVLVRSCLSMGGLAVLARIPALSGIALGVNPTNALVLGVLGAPGFALLLMLRWLLK